MSSEAPPEVKPEASAPPAEAQTAAPKEVKGLAPVKAEYLLRACPTAGGSAAAGGSGAAAAADSPEQPPQQPQRKRQRGMNKQRGVYKPDAGKINMCTATVAGRECKFGESCKYSHDLAAYFAQRPADLGELCPIYTLHGHCKFGVTCRFGASHLEDPSGVNMTRSVEVPPEQLESNAAPWDLTAKLRKHQYDFARADKLSKRVVADVAAQHEQHQANQGSYHAALRKEQEAAVAAAAEAKAAAATAGAEGGGGATAAPSFDERAADSTDAVGCERKPVDFRGKLVLAPLTTVGNLPFRRVCKGFGADITVGEMAMATNLLQGSPSEWALLKRHACEDVFGVQIAGGSADVMARAAQVVDENVEVDFVDINMGCPIDSVCNRGMGAALALRAGRVQGIVRTMSELLSCPLTVKIRTGYEMNTPTAHKLIPRLAGWGAAAVTLHGRSRQQRYSRAADWSYITTCAKLASETSLPLVGNGDVFSYEDTQAALDEAQRASAAEAYGVGKAEFAPGLASCMIARGALVKPWVFTEIKERRHWDISSKERFEILQKFTSYGLEHWGTDELGVARVRNFMLEWLSFLHRYVPVGLLERLPAKLQDRPPSYVGRDELETLMASPNAADWVKITEMLLGKAPESFNFVPKHKANAYDNAPIVAEG